MSLCKLQTSNQSKLCLSYASINANISKSMLAKKCRLSKNQDFSSMLKISLMLSTVIVPMLGSGLILGADEGVSGSTSLERKYCQVGISITSLHGSVVSSIVYRETNEGAEKKK